MYKAIIFDLAGVLLNIGGIRHSFNKLTKNKNIIPWKDFRKEWNQVKLGEIETSEFYKIISNKLELDEYEVRNAFSNIKINEEMKQLVNKLKNNYKIGILSNTTRDILHELLTIWDLENFAKITTSCVDGVAKPDLKAIDLALSKLEVKKGEAIFIDDTKTTVDDYNNYGVKSIHFQNKKQLTSELTKLGVSI